MEQTIRENNLAVVYVPVNDLINPDYNPRTWSEENTKELTESIKRYGIVDPLLVNSADERKNIVIGGNFRLKVIKELGFAEAPVVYIHIPDLDKEKELCLRLNKNQGEWDRDCKNKYIREEELIDELFKIIDQVNINELGMRMKLEEEIKRFNRLQRLATKGTPKYNINEDEINTREYAKYVLKEGTELEKRELLGHLRSRLLLEDKKISLVQ